VRESSTATKVTIGVSIVIPSWNGLEFLKLFLPSIIAAAVHYQKESKAPTEIVIVDDGSVDDSVDWLLRQGFLDFTTPHKDLAQPVQFYINSASKSQIKTNNLSVHGPSHPFLKLIRNELNQGFGPSCNRGFEVAKHPLVFLLNNDVEVDFQAIAPLVENFTDDSVFAVHCRVFDLESRRECGSGKIGGFANGFIRVHRSYVNVKQGSGQVEETAQQRRDYSMFASGGSAMFNRKTFLEIGGFDRLLAPGYWEDVEISYRAWKRGYSVYYEPRSIVHHRVSSTMRNLNQRRLTRLKQRNRLIWHWLDLHDQKLLVANVLWVILLSLSAPLRLQPGFLLAVSAALSKLSSIRKRRREERVAMRRSDAEVFDIFASLERRPDVFCFDGYEDLKALEGKRGNNQ
jgi:GT2 family glycosyltransferase